MNASPPFRIVTVCTGNICRSPAAERLLSAGLDESVSISSAGTAALVGSSIDGPMASLIQGAGARVDGFVARQVTHRLLLEADLVLALTRSHRAWLVELAPAVVRRTHTLLEFARVLNALDQSPTLPLGDAGERLRVLTPIAAAMRPMVRAAPHETDDVPDPFLQPPEVYSGAMSMIQKATATIIRRVIG